MAFSPKRSRPPRRADGSPPVILVHSEPHEPETAASQIPPTLISFHRATPEPIRHHFDRRRSRILCGDRRCPTRSWRTHGEAPRRAPEILAYASAVGSSAPSPAYDSSPASPPGLSPPRTQHRSKPTRCDKSRSRAGRQNTCPGRDMAKPQPNGPPNVAPQALSLADGSNHPQPRATASHHNYHAGRRPAGYARRRTLPRARASHPSRPVRARWMATAHASGK